MSTKGNAVLETGDIALARVHEHPVVGWIRTPRISLRGRSIPTWIVLLAAYVAARVLTTGFLAAVWALTKDQWFAHFDGGPGFDGFLQSWDVQWYQRVGIEGYPVELPIDENGDVTQNPWAFFPIFPAVVRGLMALTGLGFPSAGMIVAIVFGATATLALHRMLVQHFPARQAFWGAVFFAFGPLSFLLQVAYSEGMFLTFMFCALAAMVSRRYLLMIPFALVASFVHPGALALAAALGLQGIVRLARKQPIKWQEWVTAGAAIALITAAALSWPVLIAQITGDPSGYFDTELSWWRDFIGRVIFVPFTPFFLFYGIIFGWLGIVVVVVCLLGIIFWLTRPSTRRLGVDIWTYSVMYMAYLLAVFLPTQSLLRMLLPLSPLLGHPGLSATRRRRVITLTVSIAAQPISILFLWVIYPP
ncbi:hypothetical protein BH11ACT3_BH11ACT3_19160 [soil metagenome]